jgi:heme A synthase
MAETLTPPVPRWLRAWAVLTVLAALPLALLGAETTTKGVGMADQVSVRAPWYFFTLNLDETSRGLLIEHGHRLFGWAVGMCCIVLAVALHVSLRDRRRYLGWLALVMVSAQGVFGILRVKYNALAGPELAAFHGCFAQLAFATLVAVAVLLAELNGTALNHVLLRRAGVGLCALLYAQIVFGALVRHKLDRTAQRLHILLAFGVVVLVCWLANRLRHAEPGLRRTSKLLFALIVAQVIVGVETWMGRFGAGTLPELVTPSWILNLTRSTHHLLGTAIFSASVALAVLLCRPAAAPAVAFPAPRPLEGAA